MTIAIGLFTKRFAFQSRLASFQPPDFFVIQPLVAASVKKFSEFLLTESVI